MYYGDCLTELMKDKRNPVNRMYLHEINIKWKHFEKLAKSKKLEDIDSLTIALNELKSAISNKKYLYNKSTKNGFFEDSPIFSSSYLADLLTILIKRTQVLEQKGITWGMQSFDIGLKYNSILDGLVYNADLFQKKKTSEVLSLCQSLEIQMRIKGKRNFEKHQLVLPLLTFFTYNCLSEDDFIKTEYFAGLAKDSFQKSKTMIICETLKDGFNPNLKGTNIDSIIVLRKAYESNALADLDPDVIRELQNKIDAYLNDEGQRLEPFADKGIIE